LQEYPSSWQANHLGNRKEEKQVSYNRNTQQTFCMCNNRSFCSQTPPPVVTSWVKGWDPRRFWKDEPMWTRGAIKDGGIITLSILLHSWRPEYSRHFPV
jgi:hypothetical protein